jgi:hypothetical protein
MHTHIFSIFFYFFLYCFLFFLFFIFYFFGASDPARPQHAWTSFMRACHCAKVINHLRTVLNALKFWNKNEEEEKAYLAVGCFAGVLACWAKINGGVRWYETGNPPSTSAFLPSISSFLVCEILPVLCFSNSLYSLSVCFCLRCFRPVLVRGSLFLVWGSKKHLKVRLVSLCLFSFQFFFRLSLSNPPLFFRCSFVYIESGGSVTGGMLRVNNH